MGMGRKKWHGRDAKKGAGTQWESQTQGKRRKTSRERGSPREAAGCDGVEAGEARGVGGSWRRDLVLLEATCGELGGAGRGAQGAELGAQASREVGGQEGDDPGPSGQPR